MSAETTATNATVRLSREAIGLAAPPPVRIVHLGLGNFFRAHQAWYTHGASDGRDWGIAAFTGRSTDLADALRPQDGLYTLITRGAAADDIEVISSVVAAHPADDHRSWLGYFRSAELAIVTLTVTEAGYRSGHDGSLDTDSDVIRQDVAALRHDLAAPVRSVPARLLAGLVARDRAGLARVAVMPCDNLPGNGSVVANVVRDLARDVDPAAERVVDRAAAFVSTVIDRITPRATADDARTALGATGLADASPVITEPFSEWVISGEFPAGRPQWEQAGAVFTPDVTPFEERKLRLLNGGHSLLAYAASIRGHQTIAQACADDACRGWLNEWWDEASRDMMSQGLDLPAYRAALLTRFANPRLQHRLDQIAADGTRKLPARILPVLRAERHLGRVPVASTRVLAAWVCHLRGLGAAVSDEAAEPARPHFAGPLDSAVPHIVRLLDAELAKDDQVIAQVCRQATEFENEWRTR